MKQKYLILRNDKKTALVIREFAELDKEIYTCLCEETFDDTVVKLAISKGKDALVSTLRTQNLFPIHEYAEEIAEAVTTFYASDDDQSVELFFNDHDLLKKDELEPLIPDEIEGDTVEIDELLDDDDVPETTIEDEKSDIKKITHPLKIDDDDATNIEEDD